LTIMSCLMLTPIATVMEWLGAGASKLAAAELKPACTGRRLVGLLIVTGLLQYTSNEIALHTLSMVHPITYAIANTFKRSIVVGASLLFFGQRLPPSGAMGAAMSVLGALGYSLAIQQPQPEPRPASRPPPRPAEPAVAALEEVQERVDTMLRVEPIGRQYEEGQLTRAERRTRRRTQAEMEREARQAELEARQASDA